MAGEMVNWRKRVQLELVEHDGKGGEEVVFAMEGRVEALEGGERG